MNHNRYRTQQHTSPPHSATQPTPHNHEERATLASLLKTFIPTDTYTLACTQQLSLFITSPFQTNNHPSPSFLLKPTAKRQTLQELLHLYEANPHISYLFKAQLKQTVCQEVVQHGLQNQKNYISLCKTASQGQISSNRVESESNRKQPQKPQSRPQSNSKRVSKQGSRFCFEQKHSMFTVEEVKQSQQSDVQQSLKENTHTENRKGNYSFTQLQLNIHPNTNPSAKTTDRHHNNKQTQPKQGGHQAVYAKQETKQGGSEKIHTKLGAQQTTKAQNNGGSQREERNALQAISTNKQPNTSTTLPIPQKTFKISEAATTTAPTPSNKPQNNAEMASFATEIRRGLIQHDSYQHLSAASLQVAGDQEIQKELHKLNHEASQISELSSIISNGQQGANSRTHINSIKNDIDIIAQECFPEHNQPPNTKAFGKKENQCFEMGVPREEQKVEKINLNMIAQQRQEKANDNIVITEKKDPNKQPQFLVQYNLRFLQRKNAVTEVMRLSPLRFRPKEQLVAPSGKTQLLKREQESKKS